MSKTMFDKIWGAHEVADDLIYIDLHLVHEVTSPQAFEGLRLEGREVRRPDKTIATADHNVPTDGTEVARMIADELSRKQVETLEANCAEFGVPIYSLGSDRQGIVHVIGPELGISQPGMTIVCGDSHTATHGAFGALAVGIGTSVVGHAVEYAGETIRELSMENRMTICNMTIEGGGRAGMIAPDETTFAWIEGRRAAPADLAAAVAAWRELPTDEGAAFDAEVEIDAASLSPMVTWGTNPGQVVEVTGVVPEPLTETEERALRYMDLAPGRAMREIPLDRVFIGSCTKPPLGDLREAASMVDGRRVADTLSAMVVPGSTQVKAQAESEGLDEVFRAAGFDWRSAGCSMCLGMNPDILSPGERVASTSNRNFEGRQGRGA